MKKTVLFYLLFCVSILCCFAEEWAKDDESIKTSSFYFAYELSSPLFGSDGGLSVQTSEFGFSTVNPVLSTDSLALKQAGFDITKYSSYSTTSFWDTPVVIIGGIVILLAIPFVFVALILEGG